MIHHRQLQRAQLPARTSYDRTGYGNGIIVRRGYARLLVIEPNHAHARTMLREELDAKRAGRGLWSEC